MSAGTSTLPRSTRFLTSFAGLGRDARAKARACAVVARKPPSRSALRRSFRDTVDGERPIPAAIERNVAAVGSKTERQAARALVAAYHEARLADLIEHVAEALDRYRAGEVDAYAVDETIHQYHQAAQELWKFCWSGGVGANVEIVARTLEQLTKAGEQWTGGSASPPTDPDAVNLRPPWRQNPSNRRHTGCDFMCAHKRVGLRQVHIHDRNRSTVGSHRPGAFSECRSGDPRVRRFGLGPRVRNSCSRLLPPATPNAGRRTPVKMWHHRGAWRSGTCRLRRWCSRRNHWVSSSRRLLHLTQPRRARRRALTQLTNLGLKGHDRRRPDSR